MPIKIRPNRQSKATHYENLKVSERAPLEVIKAAYRALSMRWHPDRNPGDPRAGKIMGILNAAYDVLSDPAKRQEYDDKLAATRRTSATVPFTSTSPGNFTPTSAWNPKPSRAFSLSIFFRSIRWQLPDGKLACAAVLLAIFGVFLVNTIAHHHSAKKTESGATTPAEPSPDRQDTIIGEALPQEPSPQPVFDLRLTNPLNGQPWPKKASYLEGFEKLAMGGYSSVTVDNSKNTSAVFMKLVSVEYGEQSKVVRVCFIPTRSTFTFGRITPGRYELRYQEVEDGECLKTETFVLSETKRLRGVECTQLRIPLYGLTGRSLDLLRSDEREFITALPVAAR
ncbi:heat shock protein DnaJ domain protein [Chthoniobacter flavus Ellin428]|uniref:Heat shock protein DnaJ domain protein n=1 Tax=Chthoniobacter flavus Ellin428 TaxID=497964 RepID=B4D961_9BACT|nr:J domain-containing protein [Chthoniobacter flavus]EDY17106.1 heat shock protein DnaJ domain protein [Chthoniobacter flavus Ellin428]TCO86129.1 DnaJ-like protein [Chthoniobacter flavus]